MAHFFPNLVSRFNPCAGFTSPQEALQFKEGMVLEWQRRERSHTVQGHNEPSLLTTPLSPKSFRMQDADS